MNDDQDRELFGLPPSRQQRTPLKALEALGDENFTAHHERASVAISQGSCEARARRLTTHPSCSSYCFSHLRRGHTGQVSIRPSNNPGPSVYVVGLRLTGLVLTTIPATVLRPEPPAAGLNTSLTDPNGQWTATAKAKIIDTEGSYWEFSYRVTMNNRTSEEQEYTVKIYFVDAYGFSLDYTYAVSSKDVPANSSKTFLGSLSIDAENAPTVVGILLEVNVQ